MWGEEILRGKRILAVDDEADVLAVIQEQLATCRLTTATNFETARELLLEESFDLVILDIVGVRGFDLLNLARERMVPAVMLTSHAMTVESLQAALDQGAMSFFPKEEMHRLDELIIEVFERLESGRSHWPRLIERLGQRFKQLWGPMWDKIRFHDDFGKRK